MLHDPLVFVDASLVIDLFLEPVDGVATHYVHLVVYMVTELLLWISQLRLILSQINVCIDGKIAQSLLYLGILQRMSYTILSYIERLPPVTLRLEEVFGR